LNAENGVTRARDNMMSEFFVLLVHKLNIGSEGCMALMLFDMESGNISI
jgi:hypothetical protein